VCIVIPLGCFLLSFIYIYIYIYNSTGRLVFYHLPYSKKRIFKSFFLIFKLVVKSSTYRIFSRQYKKEKRTCSPKIVSCISCVLCWEQGVLIVFSIKHSFYNSPNEERRFRFLYNCVLPRFSWTRKKKKLLLFFFVRWKNSFYHSTNKEHPFH